MNGNQDAEILTRTQPLVTDTGGGWQLVASPICKTLWYGFADVLALLGAYAVMTLLLPIPVRNSLQPVGVFQRAVPIPLFLSVLYLFRGYHKPNLRRSDQELELLFKSVTISCFFLFAGSALIYGSSQLSLRVMLVGWISILTLVIWVRFSLRAVYAALWRRGLARTRALLITPSTQLLVREPALALQRHGYQVVEVLSAGEVNRLEHIPDDPKLSRSRNWGELVEGYQIQTLVLDCDSVDDLSAVTNCSERVGIDVILFDSKRGDFKEAREFDVLAGRLQLYSHSAFSFRIQRMLKRLIDFLFGIVGSLVTLFLTPFIAILINLEDSGPVFHRREFVSEDGSIKHYLKFRTMLRNADQILEEDAQLKARFVGNYKLRDDPRVLRVGRFLRRHSIDEFPQFLSLLLGQLTLVGPRVISAEEKDRYGDFLPKRLSVKPGITGYWQVMGRQTTTYDDRVQLDVFYVDHWSIWMDLVIIAKTFSMIVLPRGAY